MLDRDLQRYFDGELEPEERARLEAQLTPEDREKLAALVEMRGLLNATLDADAADVDIWSGVGKQLQKEKAQRGWNRRRLFGGSAATMLLAAAAAFALFLRHPGHPSNNCDVEQLEFHGAVATVMQLDDLPHKGDGTTTVIWTEEEED
jgi:anti-sigma factor RsiW